MAAKDLYEKDYYQILGVTKNADSDAIKNSIENLLGNYIQIKLKVIKS